MLLGVYACVGVYSVKRIIKDKNLGDEADSFHLQNYKMGWKTESASRKKNNKG